MKNFRVHYQIKGRNYHKDFSMSGTINSETIRISAINEIKKSHPDVRTSEITILTIEEISVW